MVLNLRRLSGKSSRTHSSRNSQDLDGFDFVSSASPEEISSSPLEISSPFPDDIARPTNERESRRWSHRKSSSSQKSSTLQPVRSMESLSTDTNDSLRTESSGSTVPGPGVISGRFIKALGSIAVLGIDNAIIKRKMSTYRRLFPHGRHVDQTGDDGREMYSEVIEFTRPDIYPAAVRREALEFLMIQINIRETNQLMRAFDEDFDHEDFRAFLFQIVDWDTEENKAAATKVEGDSAAKFASSIPLAFFIFRLSFSRKKSHRVAVDSFLLAMCAMRSLLADHLLRIFKFGQDSDYLDSLVDCPPEERQMLWKVLEYLRPGEIPYLEERLQSRFARIDEVMEQRPVRVDLRSVCFDLIEFSKNGLEHLVQGVRIWAYSHIFTLLARGGASWEALISTLGRVPHGDQYRIMSRILYCTLPTLNLSPGTSDHELVGTYQQTVARELPSQKEADILDLFFRFVIQAFSSQGSLRATLMLDQHFLSIIILCLTPPSAVSSSEELLRLISHTSATR